MTPNGSTGPRTDAGKAASSRNALKSGIYANAPVLPGEDPEARRLLIEEYYRRWTPVTPEQRFYVDNLVTAEWMLRRLRRCEEQAWVMGHGSRWYEEQHHNLAITFMQKEDSFTRLQYRINAFERSHKMALHELERLKKLDDPPDPPVLLDPQEPPPSFASDDPAPPVPPPTPAPAAQTSETEGAPARSSSFRRDLIRTLLDRCPDFETLPYSHSRGSLPRFPVAAIKEIINLSKRLEL